MPQPNQPQQKKHINYQKTMTSLVKIQPIQSHPQQQPNSQFQESIISNEKQINEGRWTQDQNLKFVIFVHYYQQIFKSKQQRKTSKIFRIFTEYLKERTAAQCRSHYQKMIAKFKTVPQLKKYYKKHFSEERYSYEFDMFKESWELSHPKNIKAQTDIKSVRQFGVQTQKQEKQNTPQVKNQPQPIPVQNIQPRSPIETSFNQYLYWYNMLNSSEMNNVNYYYWYIPQQ